MHTCTMTSPTNPHRRTPRPLGARRGRRRASAAVAAPKPIDPSPRPSRHLALDVRPASARPPRRRTALREVASDIAAAENLSPHRAGPRSPARMTLVDDYPTPSPPGRRAPHPRARERDPRHRPPLPVEVRHDVDASRPAPPPPRASAPVDCAHAWPSSPNACTPPPSPNGHQRGATPAACASSPQTTASPTHRHPSPTVLAVGISRPPHHQARALIDHRTTADPTSDEATDERTTAQLRATSSRDPTVLTRRPGAPAHGRQTPPAPHPDHAPAPQSRTRALAVSPPA